jgi:hypothetical protein
MDNERVCIPMFYFVLLIGSLIASILFAAYQISDNQLSLIGRLGPRPSPQHQGPPPLPPISPDQADDLAVGELSPLRRDYRKVVDPLKEPTRRYEQYPNGYRPPFSGGNINTPTQGYLPSYQLLGYLRKDVAPSSQTGDGHKGKRGKRGRGNSSGPEQAPDPDRMLKLFGRRTDTYNWEYYATHHDDSTLKIPLGRKGDREIFSGDTISVPGYPGRFTVELYNYEAPRYIPYL